ncbi:SH3 domain-containing protein [Rugamonas apoptosis]|uniref:SH3 domain-containing protein n=1 Tax=Rugamonas apoptosis TaxID=2758570 RepID=A0A7W2F5W4_9BURK|nr:SH3 domain-containing protein [Rugamonas apoptosis]MBA5685715.1 SH3 domain-containing protein [Rugamonas apoptosis]
MTLPRWIAGALLMLAAASSQAFDFKTVGAAPAILYDAPSTKGGKLFIVPRGTPLEVVLTYGDWVKVRDLSGELAWTEAKGLSAKRNVIVRSANVKIRATADDNGTPVFTADKGVLLELVEPAASGWAKVRHRDGLTGFIKNTDIWGL